MWYSPEKYARPIEDVNQKFLNELKGELNEKEARITLAQFLYRNIGFTTDLLTGVKLYPDQIINIKGMLQSHYSLIIKSRGGGKTFDAAILSILQCIFFPRTNILIAGPTFRTSRFIFNKIEELVDSSEAKLLFQAMGIKSKRNDEFRWRINGGSIVAIPLNGEKIRGFRANMLVVDEFLLMNEDMVEKVLMPYLAAPQDITERQIIREKEDELIRQGVLTEEERMDFGSNSKFVGLSSASYTCEYLYKKYDEFVKKIYEPAETVIEGESAQQAETRKNARYFVSQLAWMPCPRTELIKKSSN